MSPADVLLHPARLRIVVALSGRQMTARALGAVLPDVPQASLYRHLHKLLTAGMVRVAERRPVRGTEEKVYALVDERTHLAEEEMRGESREDMMRHFAAFLSTLRAEYGRYLAQEQIDLVRDGVGYHQIVLSLSDDELRELGAALNAAVRPFARNGPAPGRRRRLFSTVLMPALDDAPAE